MSKTNNNQCVHICPDYTQIKLNFEKYKFLMT